MMIKIEEKLEDIKSESACKEVFNPSYANEMDKSDSSIQSGFKLESTKLALMNEVVRHHMELEFIADDFFNKFIHSIKKDNGSKHLRKII